MAVNLWGVVWYGTNAERTALSFGAGDRALFIESDSTPVGKAYQWSGTAWITPTLAGTLAVANGGTGEITVQAAIDALTQVAGATNEHVLTKDTASGNAIFKAVPGGGGGDAITVNAAAVVDADFDDATPAAPGGDMNVKWQKDASSPANISAYVDASVLEALLTLDNLAGTLGETKGGTDQETYAQGDVLYASAANTLAKLAKGTAFQQFRMNSGATAPEWASDYKSKAFTIEDPTSADTKYLFQTDVAITVTGVSFASLGGTSVAFQLGFNTSIALGTVIHTDTCATATPEYNVSPSGTVNVPASRIVFIDVGVVTPTGDVTDLGVTIHYRVNA